MSLRKWHGGKIRRINQKAFLAIRSNCPTLSDDRALLWATMSRNLSPNFRSGLSPSSIMLGRPNLLDVTEYRTFEPANEHDREMLTAQIQLAALVGARNAVMEADATHVTQSSMSRALRNNPNGTFSENDTVSVHQRIGKEAKPRWHMGYRVICMAGRHLLVGRSNKILQIPLCQARGSHFNESDKSENAGSAKLHTDSAKDGEKVAIRTNPRRLAADVEQDPSSSPADVQIPCSDEYTTFPSCTNDRFQQPEACCEVEEIITTGLDDAIEEFLNVGNSSWSAIGNCCDWMCESSTMAANRHILTDSGMRSVYQTKDQRPTDTKVRGG